MKLTRNTMKLTAFAAALGIAFSLAAREASAEDDSTLAVKEANLALDTFKKDDPDLSPLLANAVGYAVFPSVNKGGLVVGAASGKGVLFEKGVPTGKVVLSQVTVGAQIGAQEFIEVVLFENETALSSFKRGKLAFQAGASAVTGGAGASANVKYERGVAVMTLSKAGLMYEASVGGQRFTYEPFSKPLPRT